jgi:hypothetical protein
MLRIAHERSFGAPATFWDGLDLDGDLPCAENLAESPGPGPSPAASFYFPNLETAE